MSHKKMHEDEIDIDVSLVRELVSAQFPLWANLPIKQVKSAGTDNAIYRLGTDLCVRLPRLADAAQAIEREQKWLPKLAPQLLLAVPVPLAQGKPSGRYALPWSIYRWIEGENAFNESIGDNSQAAIDLAQFIRALQQIDSAGGPLSRRGVPLVELDAEVRDAIKSLEGIIDTKAVIAVWDDCLAAPVWDKPFVWSHGDLLPGNVVVHNGQISAILDFSSVGIGDPACDVIPAWSIFSGTTRDIFRKQLNVDDATWRRGRGWALSIAVIALPYYQHTNPEFVALANRMIKEIIFSY
jgi:aminoglycoside phosphotransferase (APT) family kinase protein